MKFESGLKDKDEFKQFFLQTLDKEPECFPTGYLQQQNSCLVCSAQGLLCVLMKMVGVGQVCVSVVVLLTLLGRADAGNASPAVVWGFSIGGGLVLVCLISCACSQICEDEEDEGEVENQGEREGEGEKEVDRKVVNTEDSLILPSYEEYCEGESVPLSEYLAMQRRLEKLEQQMDNLQRKEDNYSV